MKIDLFSHFCTREFREAYFSIPLGGKGRRPDPLAIRTYTRGQIDTDIDVLWDVDQRVRVLDRHGVDLQVLTLSFPMVNGLEPEYEVRLARLANDGLAEMIGHYPDRLIGVATLPLSSPHEALKELDRCTDDLGFKGFQVSSNVNGTYLDAPEFFPVYERAAGRGLPMWIHPTTPVALDLIGTKGHMDLFFGWPLDTSIAIFKLVTAGVLERFPGLKVIVHHLGAGLIPYFIDRLDAMFYQSRDDFNIAKPPSHYWKTMYHDTAAIDADAFACGYRVFGPDHVVFAVDYPYGREKGEYFLESRRRIVDSAEIGDEAKKKIYEANARKLLRLT